MSNIAVFSHFQQRMSVVFLKWKLLLRRVKTKFWFATALTLLALTAAIAGLQARLLLVSATVAGRTYKVLFSLEKLLRELERTENCHQAYLSRHDTFDLTCLDEGRQQIDLELSTLHTLTSDRPAEQAVMDQLAKSATESLNRLAALDNYGRNPIPRWRNADEKIDPLQDQIRAQVEGIVATEQNVLTERLIARQRAVIRKIWVLGAGSVLSLCVVFIKLRREIGHRTNTQYYLRVAYAAVDQARRHLNGIIESTPDCIAACDRQLQWIAFNSSYRSLFQSKYGKSPEHGMSLRDCLSDEPEELENLSHLWAHALAGVTFTVTSEIRTRGSDTIYENRYYPILDESGTPIAACHIARDISERKRFENLLFQQSEELRRSNEELEQFAYVASHDLQEPLRMVASYVQLLAERYQGQIDAKADKYIEYAVDGARRMQVLINDLLSLSRVNARPNQLKQVDCDALLRRVIRDLEARIRESNASIELDNLGTVIADENQLLQVFHNLIANALKFRGERVPLVTVQVEGCSDHWLFSVADNGIGISSEHFDKIFVLFQRLHSRQKYDGTGIGLAICKKIIERHGGRIWLESEPGRGSIFKFTIPIRQEAPADLKLSEGEDIPHASCQTD